MTKRKNSSPLATKKTPPPPSAATASPPLDTALAALSRRTARAVASLLVRVVALGVLITLLVHEAPGLERVRGVLDAVGAALALWPFFTSLGRLYAWRIALGRAYIREERWEDAARTLAPFRHPRARLLFDAAGEGAYHLAVTRRALGQGDEARRLFSLVAGERRGPWSDAARTALESASGPR